MKRTYNINLGGEPFIVDDDAYTLLNDYLDTLQHAFSHTPDGRQIQNDIELRIAELLLEYREQCHKIVDIEQVRTVISRIGDPEEFVDLTEEETCEPESPTGGSCPGKTVPPEYKKSKEKATIPPPPFDEDEYQERFGTKNVKRRLYRDPRNKVLGGVCSGFAHYIGIDPVWIRLLMIVLFLISGGNWFIFYIIMWIIIPNANTPFKQMEMWGEKTTVRNIGKALSKQQEEDSKDPAESEEDEPQSGWMRFLNGLTSVLGVFAKIFMVALGIVAIPVVLSCILIFLFSLVGLIQSPFGTIADTGVFSGGLIAEINGAIGLENGQLPLFFYALMGMAVSLAVGLPFAAVIWCTGNMFDKNWNLSSNWRKGTLIAWIASLLICLMGGVRIANKAADKTDDDDDDIEVTEQMTVETAATVPEEATETIITTDTVITQKPVTDKP